MTKTKRTTPEINLTHDGKILNNEIIESFYNISQDDDFMFNLKQSTYSWKRINKCSAYYLKADLTPLCNDKPVRYSVTFIRSYNTIVAIYFPEFKALISFGRYSMTTYQHIRKFRENNVFGISYEYNMEYENWFWGK